MQQSGEIPVPTFALGSFTRVTLPVSSFIPWPGFSFSDQHYKIRLQLNVLLKKKKIQISSLYYIVKMYFSPPPTLPF